MMLLLCALVAGSGSAWADYEVVYNLNCPKNSKASDYTKTYDVEIDNITWNAPGNQNLDSGWRIGGKSISNAVDRVITGNTSIDEEITKITFNHNGKSRANVSVPSVTLTVASDAAFNNIVDEVVVENPDITKGEANSFDFTPTSPLTDWNNCYYKITINVSNSDSSNGGLDVTSIVFYKTVADKTSTTTAITTTGITNTDLKNGTAAGSLSASVTAGGSSVSGATVSWESEDMSVATIDEDGVVTLVGVGTTTITATYDGDDTYYGSSDTYELEVTDTREATVTSIDDAGLTNTDVYTSTVGGKLTASVTVGGSPVATATVTWESSNIDVATIDSEGNITLLKAGTTTITATYAGAGSYAASSDTYELTVIDTNAPLLYESVSLYTSTSDSSTKITSSNASNYLDDTNKWNYSSFSNAYPGRNGCFKLGSSSSNGTIVTNAISLTGSGKLTFKAKQYKSGENTMTVTATGATASGDVSVTAGSDFADYTVYLNGATGSVVITFATTSYRIFIDEIKLVNAPATLSKTVTSAGWATFAPEYPVSFSSEEAYIINTASESSTTLTEVSSVPAGTPVLLKGGGEHTLSVVTSSSTDVSSNCLKVSDGTITKDDGVYVLANGKYGVGFYLWVGDDALSEGKVYMQIPGGGSRAFFSLDGVTSVSEELRVKSEEFATAPVYDLQGRRVDSQFAIHNSQLKKGLYIVNGKKIVIK